MRIANFLRRWFTSGSTISSNEYIYRIYYTGGPLTGISHNQDGKVATVSLTRAQGRKYKRE